ncbi:MAG: hypothetical protein AABW51_00975 [Nanoarchaeota archaeon]
MEEKRKIGIDIDECVVEFVRGYLEIYKKSSGREFSFDQITSYNFWECLPISKVEAISLANIFYESDRFRNLPLIDGAKDALRCLSTNYNLFLITSRPIKVKDKTQDFFKRNFPVMDLKILFSGDFFKGGLKKSEICKQRGIEIMVEDNGVYAENCANAGVSVLLLDKPWNRGYNHNQNIHRVKNWGEILQHLK